MRISDWSSDVCSSDLDPRRVHRHREHRLLLVALGAEVGLAHHDRDLAARVADSRRPPFAAVDDIIVAVALDPRLDIGRVGRSEEHTSELKSLMRISYAAFCLKKKN